MTVPRPLAQTAAVLVAGGGLLLAAALAAVHALLPLDAVSIAVAGGSYIFAGSLLVSRIGAFHLHRDFGVANMLTLARLVVACALTGFAAEVVAGGLADAAVAWLVFGLSAGALVLDWLDGFAARRLGQVSAFGARFDMEVDAFLILVLSAIAFVLGKAGAWVMLSGLLRYFYVAAGAVWPRFTRALPPAFRRKMIAAIQGCTLTGLLIPVLQPPVTSAAAALALALLVYSFGTDIILQARRS